MPKFIDVDSQSLSSHLVFYKRLETDDNGKRAKLYNKVRSKMLEAVDAADRPVTLTRRLREQAKKEREKEIALIQDFFNAPIDPELTSPRKVMEFLDVFNSFMNIQDIYERNKQLILKAEGQKGVFSFFPFYLKKELEDTWRDVAKTLDITNEGQMIRGITDWLERSIPRAIERMFSAELETKRIDPSLKNVYMRLLGEIGTVQMKGSYAQQLADIYGLQDLADAIIEELRGGGIASKSELKSIAAKCTIDYRKGGLALESLQDLIYNVITDVDGKHPQHAVIGGKQARADNIATFNIDLTPIMERLDKGKGNLTRIEAVDLFNDIERNLDKSGRGFIVYTSDKNYTLNNGFAKKGGFAAGSDMDGNTLMGLMERTPYDGATFIGAILQLAEGAVGEDISRAYFEVALAQMIAYFLFDDFNAIGAGLTNGANTLHIMNLNGVLLPISTILYTLADAIEETIVLTPRQVVSVHIKNDPILFPNAEDQASWQEANQATASEAWLYQDEEALKNLEISIRFMAGLKKLLSGDIKVT